MEVRVLVKCFAEEIKWMNGRIAVTQVAGKNKVLETLGAGGLVLITDHVKIKKLGCVFFCGVLNHPVIF